MSDLERRLREGRPGMPEPPTVLEDRLLAAVRRPSRSPRSWRRAVPSSRGGRLIAVALLSLAAGAAALAAGLPPFGNSPEAAFVAPRTDILPGGYSRTRPPLLEELPARSSLQFPAGTTYRRALSAYYAARRRGQVVPPGAELAAPLPTGKVLLIDQGRVSLDPAAPAGYDPTTHVVVTFSGPPQTPVPLPRCQVLLRVGDPASPACDRTARGPYISEGDNGRWLPSQDPGTAARPIGSDQLAVLERPLGRVDGLDAGAFGPRGGNPYAPTPKDLARARLAGTIDGARLYVIPVGERGLCLAVRGRGADVGSSCSPRSILTSRGALAFTSGRSDGRFRVAAIVGDGFTQARSDEGTTAPIENNVFAMTVTPRAKRITITGPAGRYRIGIIGNQAPERIIRGAPIRADRAHGRVIVSIPLSNGSRSTIFVAPARGGGRCYWSERFSGCSRPGDRIAIDMVTGGFSAGGPGVPVVFSGQFAPTVHRILLRYSDGTSDEIPLTEGWALFEVPPDALTKRRMPASITTYDANDAALVTLHLTGFAQIIRQRQPHP